MAKLKLFDEIHVRVFVPINLPRAGGRAIYRTINGRPFRARFRHAVRCVFRREPSLSKTRLIITR